MYVICSFYLRQIFLFSIWSCHADFEWSFEHCYCSWTPTMTDSSLPMPPALASIRPAFLLPGGGLLKEKQCKRRITEYDVESFLGPRRKNATDRMRELDSIRMHTPLQEEVDLLNVTPYRMNLLVTQDILYLCGGLVGVRFSSEDLMALLQLHKRMTATWNELSESFKSMSSVAKKHILVTTDSGASDAVSCTSSTATTTSSAITSDEVATAQL